MRLPATPLGRDALVAAALTVVTQSELVISAARVDGPLPLQHAAFATMTAAVALRRLAPLTAVLVCAVGMALQTLAGPAPAVGGFLAMLVVIASLGYHRPVRPGMVGLAAIGVAATLYDILADTLVVADLVGNVAILLLAWGAARMVRVSTDRRVAAEVDRERAASQAVRDERSRIARDLHDSVAHALTVMTLQAGVARERSSEPGAAQCLEAIEQEGREALADMHRFLRLLGEDGQGPAETPGIQDLPDLVARVRASGLAVDLAVGPGVADLPASVSATAYRVVQEGLTNAIKH